jgi:predicted 2-oxoglutarate/Fe(II)-dependent dioxygenase YbiX/peroxiredoxin
MRARPLTVGEPAPSFLARSTTSPRFHFDTVAGRYVALCFFGSAADPASRRILDDILQARPQHFDDFTACFFGVSTDPDDERLARVQEHVPGVRFFWDFDRSICHLYGADHDGVFFHHTVLLDWRLRALAVLPFDPPETHVPRLLDALAACPPPEPPTMAADQAPVLVVPRVFDPELCRVLVGYFQSHGGDDSGFMLQDGGRTVEISDHTFKRRRDCAIQDESIRRACMVRVHDRLAPEILKAYQFRATRIERYIVACYDAADAGFFRPHRDNTTTGTAHRQFAVSLNLNTGAYDGGLLRFPEFGGRLYQAPAGGAVVFSCSLLHEATPVTRGQRYAFLPFLYDDAAAEIRERNRQFIVDDTATSAGA